MSYNSMLFKPYEVKYDGKVHTFKNLGDAFIFCDKHKLPYPHRFYEVDGQPHIRELLVTGSEIKKNRARQIKESREFRELQLFGMYQ